MTESFHILHPTPHASVPLPITFYISEELMADEGHSDADLAALLLHDLEIAVAHHRQRLLSKA